jgi:hypothetical protein
MCLNMLIRPNEPIVPVDFERDASQIYQQLANIRRTFNELLCARAID